MRDPEKFWQKVQEHFFTDEHGELDYSDFIDFGEECGLLMHAEYDPEKHGEGLLGDPEPGDPIYIPVDEGGEA